MDIKQYADIGHGSPKDLVWIAIDSDLQVVSAGKNRTHTSVWGLETNIEGHWRGRYDVATGYCSIATSEFEIHMRRPPRWLLTLLRDQFSVVKFYYFADGIESFSPNPRKSKRR